LLLPSSLCLKRRRRRKRGWHGNTLFSSMVVF
jgi:hypothetical protein